METAYNGLAFPNTGWSEAQPGRSTVQFDHAVDRHVTRSDITCRICTFSAATRRPERRSERKES